MSTAGAAAALASLVLHYTEQGSDADGCRSRTWAVSGGKTNTNKYCTREMGSCNLLPAHLRGADRYNASVACNETVSPASSLTCVIATNDFHRWWSNGYNSSSSCWRSSSSPCFHFRRACDGRQEPVGCLSLFQKPAEASQSQPRILISFTTLRFTLLAAFSVLSSSRILASHHRSWIPHSLSTGKRRRGMRDM
jgi:hypothetical protein